MPSPLTNGASFGPFQLMKKLGSGGQAEVWAARKPAAGIERVFAVKIVWSDNVDDPQLNELVLREARVLGLLAGHPNIIGITELGVLPGCFYLQMDYAHGWDLQRILSLGTRFPVEIALHVIACACAALEFAHSPHGVDGRRIIHRDIKPANILITHWGDVKLVDFGVAKLLSERHTLTRVAGTLPYFPPEAYAIDSSPTPRYDLFALGAVLWECLAGARLFRGDTDQEIVARTMACQIPTLASQGVQVSPAVEWIIGKLLAKDPGERFQSAGEALAAIRNTPEGRAAGTYDLKMFLIATQPPPEDVTQLPVTSVDRLPVASTPPSAVSARGQSVPLSPTVTSTSVPRRWAAIGVIAVAAAAIAGGIVAARNSGQAVVARAPDSTSIAAMPLPDARPRPGRVTLDVTPRDASVSIDGAPIPGPPFVATGLVIDQKVNIRVERPGYQPYQSGATVTEDARLVVELQSLPTPEPLGRPASPPRPRSVSREHTPKIDPQNATGPPRDPKTAPSSAAKPPETKPPDRKRPDKDAIKDID